MKRKIGNSWGVGVMHDPSGTEIARGWGGGSNWKNHPFGGGGVWIFSGITHQIKRCKVYLPQHWVKWGGKFGRGYSPPSPHNIVGRPTLETNNLGAPVSQCILSDQGEILAKKNMAPLFTNICFSWRSNTIIMDLLSHSIIFWSSWDFHDN